MNDFDFQKGSKSLHPNGQEHSHCDGHGHGHRHGYGIDYYWSAKSGRNHAKVHNYMYIDIIVYELSQNYEAPNDAGII